MGEILDTPIVMKCVFMIPLPFIEKEFDTDTTYNYKIVLQENEADGSYLYNLRIGWEDFIYEAGDYGKRMRGYGDKMYLSIREVEPCKN